jgi:hypothetical protein
MKPVKKSGETFGSMFCERVTSGAHVIASVRSQAKGPVLPTLDFLFFIVTHHPNTRSTTADTTPTIHP